MADSATIVVAIIEVILALECINCNSAALATIIVHESLHTPQYIFIACLLAADLLMSVIGSPISILMMFNYETDYLSCSFMSHILLTFTVIPNIMLCCVTFDRFISIRYSLRYYGIMDNDIAWITPLVSCILFSSIVQIPIGVLRYEETLYNNECHLIFMFSKTFLAYYRLISFFSVFSVLFLVYVYIWTEVKRHVRTSETLYINPNSKQVDISTRSVYFIGLYLLFSLPLTVEALLHVTGIVHDVTNEGLEPVMHLGLIVDKIYLILNPFLYTNGSAKIKSSLRRAHFMEEKVIQQNSVPPSSPVVSGLRISTVSNVSESGVQLVNLQMIKQLERVRKNAVVY